MPRHGRTYSQGRARRTSRQVNERTVGTHVARSSSGRATPTSRHSMRYTAAIARRARIRRAIVIQSAVAVGLALGLTLLAEPFKGLYYNSYSLPPLEQVWSWRVVIVTSVLPFVLLVGITLVGLLRKMKFTPLVVNPLSPSFYYIGIKSVSVNGAKLRIHPSVWSINDNGNGGTVIDSGTTLTFLAEQAHREVVTAIRRRVRELTVPSPTLAFELCVNESKLVKGASLPRLKFELVGNSVFSPPPRNYFIETEERVMCLAIQPVNSETGFSVIGNLMQQGFLLEFDRDRSRLGFSRRGCDVP